MKVIDSLVVGFFNHSNTFRLLRLSRIALVLRDRIPNEISSLPSMVIQLCFKTEEEVLACRYSLDIAVVSETQLTTFCPYIFNLLPSW